jgi:Ca2+/Na+ antiporter
MASSVFGTFSLVFAIIAGTAAGVLSLLMLEILRRTPFGRAVLALTVVMILFVGYHVVLILNEPFAVADVVQSVLYTAVAVFVWLMVWSQRRMRRHAEGVEG